MKVIVKKLSETAKAGLIIGLVLVISLIIYLYFSGIAGQFSGTPGYNCSQNEEFSFSVFSKDMNRSHIVNISVYNSSHWLQTEGSYEMLQGNPSGGIESRFHPTTPGDTNNSVTFIVDGNRSFHYEQLFVSSSCSEAFYLDPEKGIIRPYEMWCTSRACNSTDKSPDGTRLISP